jgi:uncharacterized membrane protein
MAPERTVAVMAAAMAGAFLIGSVATIQLWMLRAIRSTSPAAIAQAAAIVEEAVMAAATGVAVAIDAAALSEKQRFFGPPQGWFF